jgi:hypothetical protein
MVNIKRHSRVNGSVIWTLFSASRACVPLSQYVGGGYCALAPPRQ